MSDETPTSSSPKIKITTNRQENLSGSEIDVLRAWATDTDNVSCFHTLDIQASIDKTLACLINRAIPYPCLQAIHMQETHIGLIFVTPVSWKYNQCTAKVGFCLDKKYLDQGIVESVLKVMIPIIFREWPDLERLEAKVGMNDGASRRTLEGAGFRRDGVLRKYRILEGRSVDVAMYSFLSSNLRVGLSLV